MGIINKRFLRGVLGGIVAILIVAGGIGGNASAKVLGKIKVKEGGLIAGNTFGFNNKSSFNYAQDRDWISGWNSKSLGCGPVAVAIARAYVPGKGVNPGTLFAKAPLAKLNNNNGTSDSDFKFYAKKVGLTTKKVSNARQMLYELYKNHMIIAHVDHHWVAIYAAFGAVKRSSTSVSWGSSKNKYKIINVHVSDPGAKAYRGKVISVDEFMKKYNKIKAVYSVYK